MVWGKNFGCESKIIWVPPGFSHGFLSLSDSTEVLYKTTTYYSPEKECVLQWNDNEIGVEWPFLTGLTISEKDSAGKTMKELSDANLLL